jgi:hypothetical protein
MRVQYLLPIAPFLEGHHSAIESGHLAMSHAFKVWLDLTGRGSGLHCANVSVVAVPGETKTATKRFRLSALERQNEPKLSILLVPNPHEVALGGF